MQYNTNHHVTRSVTRSARPARTEILSLAASLMAIFALAPVVACSGTGQTGESTSLNPKPSPQPNPQPDPAPGNCESHRYSSCPEGCIQDCVGSCDMCNDCDGPGSCRSPDGDSTDTRPQPLPPATASCQAGQFRSEVPEDFRRCGNDADCTQVSTGCCPHQRIIVATEHSACVAPQPCDQEPGTFACIAIAVSPPACREGVCQ